MEKSQKSILVIAPFIFLALLLGLLAMELFYGHTKVTPSNNISRLLPEINLPLLDDHNKRLMTRDLKGKVSLINFWASWCYACAMEQKMLMKVKDEYHIPIYGIDYKDNSHDAMQFLHANGNPFIAVADDKNGDAVIDFGVYGTPETFIVDKTGEIVYRHVGVVDQKVWDNELYPLIKKYDSDSR